MRHVVPTGSGGRPEGLPAGARNVIWGRRARGKPALPSLASDPNRRPTHLDRETAVKFLVISELETLRSETFAAVMRMPEYAEKVRGQGKLAARYHVVGKHGGAWIYDVDSNEELERLLAAAPVFNLARYDVYPLAEMESPAGVLRPPASPTED